MEKSMLESLGQEVVGKRDQPTAIMQIHVWSYQQL